MFPFRAPPPVPFASPAPLPLHRLLFPLSCSRLVIASVPCHNMFSSVHGVSLKSSSVAAKGLPRGDGRCSSLADGRLTLTHRPKWAPLPRPPGTPGVCSAARHPSIVQASRKPCTKMRARQKKHREKRMERGHRRHGGCNKEGRPPKHQKTNRRGYPALREGKERKGERRSEGERRRSGLFCWLLAAGCRAPTWPTCRPSRRAA